MDEGFVELRGAGGIRGMDFNLDAGVPRQAKPCPETCGLGSGGGDHAVDARRDDRVGTGGRAAVMGARLQGDVEGRTAGTLAGFSSATTSACVTPAQVSQPRPTTRRRAPLPLRPRVGGDSGRPAAGGRGPRK